MTKLPKIALGAWAWGNDGTFGNSLTAESLKPIFDTAIAYQSGTSEQYVGRALRDFAKREDVVVATKFLPRTQEEIEKGVSGQRHECRMHSCENAWKFVSQFTR